MSKSTGKKGSEYEKEVEKQYQEKGYFTHRNPKTSYGKQDILTIADIIATSRVNFILIACAVGRAQTVTVKKIKEVRLYLPLYIKVYYHILKKNGTEEIRKY